MSAVKDPLPRATRMPQHAQERGPSTTEAAAKAPATDRQPIPDNADNVGAAPSPTSVVAEFAHAGATSQPELPIPPGFDFVQRDSLAPTGALPTESESLGLGLASTHGFTPPTGGASTIIQRDPLDQVPPLSMHAHAYDFIPRQDLDPTRSNPEHNRFGVAGGGQMFGLQPLGYSEPMAFLPCASAGDDAQPNHGMASMQTGEDAGISDFALMDDTLMAWSNLPPPME